MLSISRTGFLSVYNVMKSVEFSLLLFMVPKIIGFHIMQHCLAGLVQYTAWLVRVQQYLYYRPRPLLPVKQWFSTLFPAPFLDRESATEFQGARKMYQVYNLQRFEVHVHC
uniref:(northern house mosquito) hypothetical protein n=1 Tax=Culex pipiens TaxID=7175 RepID=A0A8D8AV43_CULPI